METRSFAFFDAFGNQTISKNLSAAFVIGARSKRFTALRPRLATGLPLSVQSCERSLLPSGSRQLRLTIAVMFCQHKTDEGSTILLEKKRHWVYKSLASRLIGFPESSSWKAPSVGRRRPRRRASDTLPG
jgi:hypothetical protein